MSEKEKDSLSKDNLLKREIEVNQGLITQKEVDIEASWRVLNVKQNERAALVKQVADLNDQIMEIKSETPMRENWEQEIKNLIGRKVVLGETNEKAKNGDRIWRGLILKNDIESERLRSQIMETVGKREYLKSRLKTLTEMQMKGYQTDYEKFQEEILAKDKGLNPLE